MSALDDHECEAAATVMGGIEVRIDGVLYVRADQQPMESAMNLLREVYGALWGEAYYDAYNERTRDFAKPLADKMSEANKILRFKK